MMKVTTFFCFRIPSRVSMAWRGRGPLWLGLLALMVAASSGVVSWLPKTFLSSESGPQSELIVMFAETAAQKDIPAPKMSQMMGPTIKFLYCYS